MSMKNIQLHPTVSVIIPCFNQAHFLSDCIASLQAQTYTNWEAIIVNDGSTDNTRDLAKYYCQLDDKFIYIEQKNQGLSAARNAGLEKATGKYIQFLDADDVLLPLKLEKQVQILEQTKRLCLAISDYYYCDSIDINKRVLETINLSPYFDPSNALKEMIVRWEDTLSIPPHCFLFDARIFSQHSIRFNTFLPNHEDWDCWLSIFSHSPEIFFIEEKLVAYRQHDSSMTTNSLKMYSGFIKTINQQKKKFKHHPDLVNLLNIKMIKVKQIEQLEKAFIIFEAKKNSKFLKLFKKYTPWPVQKALAKFL